MPISFKSIPAHIAESVVQKLALKDFVEFQKSSGKALKSAEKVRTRFSVSNETLRETFIWFKYENETLLMSFGCNDFRRRVFRDDFYDSPVRFEVEGIFIESTLSEEFCSSLTNYILSTNSTAQFITFDGISCSTESFNRLLEAVRVKSVTYMESVSSEYVKVEAIRKVKNIIAFVLLENEDLCYLKNAHNLALAKTNVTSAGINALLKDCLQNKRDNIDWIIYTDNNFRAETIVNGIPHRNCGYVNESQFFVLDKSLKIFIDPNFVKILPCA